MLVPGTLWTKTTERSRHALACGAQQPIATSWRLIEHRGICFLVRVLATLEQKARAAQTRAQQPTARDFDPFLPYDEDLFVADISNTHLCLLNKYNVIDNHLLIVTRAFEDQEDLLTLADFAALWACLAEIDGLGFYNGGAIAGASQGHKHLQLVPLPFVPDGPRVPIEPALASATFQGAMGTSAALPFVHSFARLEPSWSASPATAAQHTLALYRAMLQTVGLASSDHRQAGPYNLLITREWILLVPRAREAFDSISINSLGFAGSLFVRNPQELAVIEEHGPMTLLEHVAVRL